MIYVRILKHLEIKYTFENKYSLQNFFNQKKSYIRIPAIFDMLIYESRCEHSVSFDFKQKSNHIMYQKKSRTWSCQN